MSGLVDGSAKYAVLEARGGLGFHTFTTIGELTGHVLRMYFARHTGTPDETRADLNAEIDAIYRHWTEDDSDEGAPLDAQPSPEGQESE